MEKKEGRPRKSKDTSTNKVVDNEEPPRRRPNYHKECYNYGTQPERRNIRHKKEESTSRISAQRKAEKIKEIDEEIEAKKTKEKARQNKQRSFVEEDTRAVEKERSRRLENKLKRIEGTKSDETVEGNYRKERRRSSNGLHRRESEKESRDQRDRRSSRRKVRDDSKKEFVPKTDRHCYSDSELDQTRPNVTEEIGKKDESDMLDTKSIDISAMYNLFYQEESQNRKQKEKVNVGRKDVKKRTKATDAPDVTAPCDQSNVRGKLIRVLFKKVKELLKETEKLRDERKEFVNQIEELSRQVAGLKMREEDHMTIEKKIQERLNVMVSDENVTNKGTTFREEVQSILNDIQAKYVTHWQNHERNMQQVQTHAESQIQTLMNSIVGKYVQISEFQRRGSQQNSLNLSTNTTPNEQVCNELYNKSNDDLSDFSLRYMKPLFVDTGPGNVTGSVANPVRQRIPEISSSTLDSTTDLRLLKIADQQSKNTTRQRSFFQGQKTEFIDHSSSLKDKCPSKEDLKEFWRHKLLQPNPIDVIRKEKHKENENENGASAVTRDEHRTMSSRFVSRNQY